MDRKTQNDDKVLYIDYINYDIHISPPEGEIFIDWFMCDESIAETISILNKKGYITDSNSCGGHMPIIRGQFITNYDVVQRGPYIAFKENISIPVYPKGFYNFPMSVGTKFSNCLVSSIEGLYSEDYPIFNFLPHTLIDISYSKEIPQVDNSGFVHIRNGVSADNFCDFYAIALDNTRKSLNEWAKSLPPIIDKTLNNIK